jgi:hypothetical protein
MAHQKQYFFFVDNEKYESDLESLTGAQIKAKVPNWDPAYGLLLEGHGKDPDRLIGDSEAVSLEKDHGPLRFTHVPPASFGQS